MTPVADGFYVPGSGWLYRLDPRTKLLLSLLIIVLCIATGRIVILGGALVAVHLILLLGGLPFRQVAKVWRAIGSVVVIILVLQPILVPGDDAALWQLGPVRITASGLMLGLRYALRIAAAAFAALIPVLTTPINTFVRGLQKMGLPYAWAMTIGLALRYLGTIGDLYTTISEAQQARGWEASGARLMARARALVPTLIAVIVASLRLSDTLALGLAARGFGLKTGRGRTTWHDITMQPADWLVTGGAVVCFAAVLLIFG